MLPEYKQACLPKLVLLNFLLFVFFFVVPKPVTSMAFSFFLSFLFFFFFFFFFFFPAVALCAFTVDYYFAHFCIGTCKAGTEWQHKHQKRCID